jgi:hypothetical protein
MCERRNIRLDSLPERETVERTGTVDWIPEDYESIRVWRVWAGKPAHFFCLLQPIWPRIELLEGFLGYQNGIALPEFPLF